MPSLTIAGAMKADLVAEHAPVSAVNKNEHRCVITRRENIDDFLRGLLWATSSYTSRSIRALLNRA